MFFSGKYSASNKPSLAGIIDNMWLNPLKLHEDFGNSLLVLVVFVVVVVCLFEIYSDSSKYCY